MLCLSLLLLLLLPRGLSSLASDCCLGEIKHLTGVCGAGKVHELVTCKDVALNAKVRVPTVFALSSCAFHGQPILCND
jgi:hypothetical protein